MEQSCIVLPIEAYKFKPSDDDKVLVIGNITQRLIFYAQYMEWEEDHIDRLNAYMEENGHAFDRE